MNRYYNIAFAREKWEARRLRIKPYNILAVMFTSDEKELREFDKLPYEKKVCFVPFETDVDSAYELSPGERDTYNELWKRAKDQNRKLKQTEYARRLGDVNGTLIKNELHQDEQDMLQIYRSISSERKEDLMPLAKHFQMLDRDNDCFT